MDFALFVHPAQFAEYRYCAFRVPYNLLQSLEMDAFGGESELIKTQSDGSKIFSVTEEKSNTERRIDTTPTILWEAKNTIKEMSSRKFISDVITRGSLWIFEGIDRRGVYGPNTTALSHSMFSSLLSWTALRFLDASPIVFSSHCKICSSTVGVLHPKSTSNEENKINFLMG